MTGTYYARKRWEMPWQADVDVLALGEGVQVKVLRDDRTTSELDLMIRFPPGYTEPAHTHDSSHSTMVLEGTQVVGDVQLRPGDYGYGPPGEVHGPFSYPEGCVVFACFRGDSAHHVVAASDGGHGA